MTNTSVQPPVVDQSGYAAKKRAANIAIYIILSIMVVIWIFPIVWLVIQAFRGEEGISTSYFFPKQWTFDNFVRLFVERDDATGEIIPQSEMIYPYGKWILNTFFVAICSCIISTLIILMVSYAFSRLRFKSRKTFLNLGLILGMFPGFMSMAATYAIIEIIGLKQSLFGLILVYSAGAGLGYQVSKGFFDTIPRSLDEAAKIDGATRNQIFWIIILPLSKPIIVYTALTTFIGPWGDYIFVSYFMKANKDNFTVALGLYSMLEPEHISKYFTTFCAGAVLIAIPITILFIIMQRFYVAGVTGGAVKG